jgi:hypothetical protein
MEVIWMPATLEQTRNEALLLPEKDRAHLAHILIASLEMDSDDYSAEWDAEIDRRVKEIDLEVARGRAGADVLQDIRLRYS